MEVTGVTLNKTSANLTVGDTETLTATVAPSNATNKNVTWSTSDASVATVSNGAVKAVAPGTATITVTTVDGSKTATCTVTVNAPVVKPELFDLSGATATLGNNLAINFVIDTAKLDGTGHYAEITKKYADGRADVTVTVDQEDWKVYSGNLYYFSFDGVAAKEMADQLIVKVYNKNNVEVTNVWNDSLREYAMRALTNEEKKASPDREKLALYVDMLNYGAAAQVYFEYNENDLANKNLTAAQKAYATGNVTMEDIREKGTGYVGTTLTLESQILLNFVFENTTANNATHAIATYTDHYGNAKTVRIEKADFKAYDSTRTYISVSGMAVADCGQPVTLKLYNGNQLLSTSVDGVESYISRIASANELYTMIMKFATSSYNSFH